MRNLGTRGESWSFCARCGFEFPLSKLTFQSGVKTCSRCYDNPEPAMHAALVQKALESDDLSESSNEEAVDMGFFAGLHDEEVI